MRCKFLVLVFLLFKYLNAFSTEINKNETIVTSCQVNFSLGKDTFNKKELQNCINKIENKDVIRYISIIASASPNGSEEFNQKLTDKRVKSISNVIEKNFITLSLLKRLQSEKINDMVELVP